MAEDLLVRLPTVRDIAVWLDSLAFENDPRDTMNKRRGAAMESARAVYEKLRTRT